MKKELLSVFLILNFAASTAIFASPVKSIKFEGLKKTKDFASLRRIISERGIFCDDSQSYEKRKAGMEGFYAIKNLLNWVFQKYGRDKKCITVMI